MRHDQKGESKRKRERQNLGSKDSVALKRRRSEIGAGSDEQAEKGFRSSSFWSSGLALSRSLSFPLLAAKMQVTASREVVAPSWFGTSYFCIEDDLDCI